MDVLNVLALAPLGTFMGLGSCSLLEHGGGFIHTTRDTERETADTTCTQREKPHTHIHTHTPDLILRRAGHSPA